MFFVFWLILHSLSPAATASTHPSCARYFDLYLRGLFQKPDAEKIFTPSYLMGEASRRLRNSGDVKLSEIIGSHYNYESVKNWKMKVPDLNGVKGPSVEVKVWNTQTGESKIVSVPLDLDAHRERLFFSNLKIANGLKVPKVKLENYSKMNVVSYETDKSMLAAALFYAPEETLKTKSLFFQNALHHSAQLSRLQGILKGTQAAEHLEDLIGVSKGATLSWSSLAKRAGAKADPNFVKFYYDGAIHAARLQESAGFHGMSRDDAFNAFLLQIHDLNTAKISNKGYAVSFSHVDEHGKSLNFHYLDAGKMEELNQLRDHPEVVPEQWMNAPEDVRRYVENSYRKRLNLTEAQLSKLMEISRSMQKRTDYLFIADEQFMKLTPYEQESWSVYDQQWEKITREKKEAFDHFTVKGSMSIVYSGSAEEQLPLELFTGVKIARPAEGKVVEIGRFTVDPELRPLGPKRIWKAVAAVAAKDGVAKICAETTEEYAKELIEKFGFKKVAQRLNFEGKPEYIIEVTPKEFFNNSVLNGMTQ